MQAYTLPLFTRIQKDNEEDKFMCQWFVPEQIEDDEEIEDDATFDDTSCKKIFASFKELMDHFKDHSFHLVPQTDYCTDCEVVHGDKIELIEHHLSHILSSKDFPLTCDPKPNPDLDVATTTRLNFIFEKVKEIRQGVWELMMGHPEEDPTELTSHSPSLTDF